MLNSAILMGRLVADPELRTTGTGISVTSFTIAVNRSFVKAGEERQADFIDIVAWRSTAEFISKYFSKGSMIAIQGTIQTRSYEDRNGIRRKAFEVIADKVSFCGSRSDNAQTGNRFEDSQIPREETSYQSGTAEDFSQPFPAEDDLPF